jgi:hypothetical protein
MPIFRALEKLVYFAHIPKCGGTSIESYIKERFGAVAFLDNQFTKRDPSQKWSKTSPQHVDRESLEHLFPPGFFDATFAVVRHPVSRIISAYHFQINVEKSIPISEPFSVWLENQARILKHNPFTLDNHFRPQVDLVPRECTIFHLEYGLQAIIPYLDRLVGDRHGPRAIAHTNKRASSGTAGHSEPAALNSSDLALIEQIYAADFARFGYVTQEKYPNSPRPELEPSFLKQNTAERARMERTLNKYWAKVKRRLQS